MINIKSNAIIHNACVLYQLQSTRASF